MLLRDDHEVHGSARIDVPNREDEVIVVQRVGWHLALGHLAEQAVGHRPFSSSAKRHWQAADDCPPVSPLRGWAFDGAAGISTGWLYWRKSIEKSKRTSGPLSGFSLTTIFKRRGKYVSLSTQASTLTAFTVCLAFSRSPGSPLHSDPSPAWD